MLSLLRKSKFLWALIPETILKRLSAHAQLSWHPPLVWRQKPREQPRHLCTCLASTGPRTTGGSTPWAPKTDLQQASFLLVSQKYIRRLAMVRSPLASLHRWAGSQFVRPPVCVCSVDILVQVQWLLFYMVPLGPYRILDTVSPPWMDTVYSLKSRSLKEAFA